MLRNILYISACCCKEAFPQLNYVNIIEWVLGSCVYVEKLDKYGNRALHRCSYSVKLDKNVKRECVYGKLH